MHKTKTKKSKTSAHNGTILEILATSSDFYFILTARQMQIISDDMKYGFMVRSNHWYSECIYN